MYWISKKEHSLRIAIGKKRLRDFKPEEGCEYLVPHQQEVARLL